MRKTKKTVEYDKSGWLRVYPSLHESKDKFRIKHLLRILKRLKKGH